MLFSVIFLMADLTLKLLINIKIKSFCMNEFCLWCAWAGEKKTISALESFTFVFLLLLFSIFLQTEYYLSLFRIQKKNECKSCLVCVLELKTDIEIHRTMSNVKKYISTRRHTFWGLLIKLYDFRIIIFCWSYSWSRVHTTHRVIWFRIFMFIPKCNTYDMNIELDDNTI